MKKFSLLLIFIFLFQCGSSQKSDSVKNLFLFKFLDSDSSISLLTAIPFEKSNYTISQDLSSISTLEVKEKELNVSFEKKGEKYISKGMKLSQAQLKDKLTLKTALDIKFELYTGISTLNSISGNQKRFVDLSKDSRLKLNKNKNEYIVEFLSSGDYTLFLVSDTNGTAKVQKKIATSSEKIPFKLPSQNIKITETVKTLPSLEVISSYSGREQRRTAQVSIDALKGDKIITRITVAKKQIFPFMWSPWYRETRDFTSESDMKSRVIECNSDCSDWPSVFSFHAPGTTFIKSGAYSKLGYSYQAKNDKNPTIKIVKVTPYIPSASSTITPIGSSYKTIDYHEGKKNEIYSSFTSNQFTLSNVQIGTKLIIEHTTGSFTAHKESETANPTFYTGTDRLTSSNIRTRFISSGEVLKYGSYNYSMVFGRAGDYSIVFTNHSKTKPTTHRVKFE